MKTFLRVFSIAAIAVGHLGLVGCNDPNASSRSESVAAVDERPAIIAVVSGLTGHDFTFQLNDAQEVRVDVNGETTLGRVGPGEERYVISVLKQPTSPPQTCTIRNNSGNIPTEDDIRVYVECTPWTKQAGAGGFSYSEITVMATDALGNVYAAGETEGGALEGNHSWGEKDIFLAKYNTFGQKVYLKQWGSPSYEVEAKDVVTDTTGNIHVIGTKSKSTFASLVITKYNKTGEILYEKEYAESGGKTGGMSADTDRSGNLYIAETVSRARNKDPKTGGRQSFLLKLDPEGKVLFRKNVSDGFEGRVTAYSVKVDHSGDVLVLGVEINLDTDVHSHFIKKYDSSGKLLLTEIIARLDRTRGMHLSKLLLDNENNVILVGGLYGEWAKGNRDFFLMKYQIGHGEVYRRQLGSERDLALAYGAATDEMGNVFIVGETTEGLEGRETTGGRDAFLLKYDSNGQNVYTRQFGVEGGATSAHAVIVDEKGNALVGGYTWGELDGHIRSGKIDYFIVKYASDGTKL